LRLNNARFDLASMELRHIVAALLYAVVGVPSSARKRRPPAINTA